MMLDYPGTTPALWDSVYFGKGCFANHIVDVGHRLEVMVIYRDGASANADTAQSASTEAMVGRPGVPQAADPCSGTGRWSFLQQTRSILLKEVDLCASS